MYTLIYSLPDSSRENSLPGQAERRFYDNTAELPPVIVQGLESGFRSEFLTQVSLRLRVAHDDKELLLRKVL